MVVESFWIGLPGYQGIQKGRQGIGYGYRRPPKQKRKALREIKKLGFDKSEIWGLSHTIMEWLSDTFGGFFKKCGSSDSWGDYDLKGRRVDFWGNRDSEDYWKELKKWEDTRYNSFKNHLRDFLKNSGEIKKVSDFCSPRLRYLAKVARGYPGGGKYSTLQDWTDSIRKMAEDLENGIPSENFIEDFFTLWD